MFTPLLGVANQSDWFATAPALPIPMGVLVVVAVVAVAFALFVFQPVSIDVTAIAVMVAVIVLGPWTGVTPAEGVSGFSNPATVSVLSMFVLAEGIRKTGVIQILTRRAVALTGGSERRQLLATVGVVGPVSGFVENTPIVAMLIPAVTSIAEETGTSPSRLLIPLSYAAILGGMLTVIGTSTSLLASQVWASVGGPGAQPFGIFEFTKLGVLVLLVGSVYLLTIGRRLVPERLPAGSIASEYAVADYLTEVAVGADSHLVGMRVADVRDSDLELLVFEIDRDGRTIARGVQNERIHAGDILSVRATRTALQRIVEAEHLTLPSELPGALAGQRRTEANGEGAGGVDAGSPTAPEATPEAVEREDESTETGWRRSEPGGEPVSRAEVDGAPALSEVVLLATEWSTRANGVADFERRYDVVAVAIRRGSAVRRRRLRDVRLRAGDVLLVQATEDVLDRLQDERDVVVIGTHPWEQFDRSKLPVALAIMAGVVGLAALDYLPIVVSALLGVVAMLVTGVIRPTEAYDAVRWDVIFLLAGVIPLGLAIEHSGAATLLASTVVSASGALPTVGFLLVFYLLTAVVTELISNNASVVLMLPIAVDAANRLGANAFSFAIAVTFAASTPFLSPVGYQTNLMVYGPGGYRFTDFARVGAPLLLVLSLVTTAGIVVFWGV